MVTSRRGRETAKSKLPPATLLTASSFRSARTTIAHAPRATRPVTCPKETSRSAGAVTTSGGGGGGAAITALVGERLPGVDALGVPEPEPARVLASRRGDLVGHLDQRVRVREREVLEPRDQLHVPALQLATEVEQGAGDGPSGVRVGILDSELARAEVRRVDHRVERVDVGRHLLRHLADPEVVRGREPEDVGRDADAERVQLRGRVAEEAGDRRALRLPDLVPVDDLRDVAVAREPHVVELDLVEAGLGGCFPDADD